MAGGNTNANRRTDIRVGAITPTVCFLWSKTTLKESTLLQCCVFVA